MEEKIVNKAPTPRQRKVAKAIIENKLSDTPVSTRQVLESVGYGTGLQNSPHRVLESQGFKKALAEFGLTEELITTSLVEDIKAKPEKRVKELGLGAEILGMKKHEPEPQKPQSGNIYNVFFTPAIQSQVREMEEQIKRALMRKPNVQEN